jgi:hypothetical protein
MINALLFLALFILLVQIVLFFVIRARKKKLKSESVIERYDIHSRADAWKLLSDPNLPVPDREKIKKLYEEMR